MPNMALAASPLAFTLHPEDLDASFLAQLHLHWHDVERYPPRMPLLVACVMVSAVAVRRLASLAFLFEAQVCYLLACPLSLCFYVV